MTEEQLRRWVNGELTAAERRDVTRWLVRCTEPDLPALLDGMIRERHERAADDALRQHGGLWQAIVDGWHQLLAGGNAAWVGVGGVALASAEAGPWLQVTPTSASSAEVRVHGGGEVALFLSTDAPGIDRILAAQAHDEVTWPVVVTISGMRPTVWAARGAALPRHADPARALVAALDDPHVEVASLRWDPGDF